MQADFKRGRELNSGFYANQLRQEIAERNHRYASGRCHVESLGSQPVVVYAPQSDANGAQTHGNFLDETYQAILAQPDWKKRLNKIHTGSRTLPKLLDEPGRKWCELDSSMSSDALLMNIFCAPGVATNHAVQQILGIDTNDKPTFGWKARVPLKSGLTDRTEVDMRWDNLLIEAKLTELDFQTRAATFVEAYRDFDTVFDRELLPRIEIRQARRKLAAEMPEEFTQEWEPVNENADEIAREYQAEIAQRAWQASPSEPGYAGYQLIRNALAAYATGSSFCLIHDDRRPDLREAWFEVLSAVKTAEMRTRLKVLTWQELSAVLPCNLQAFLEVKYGIAASGRQL